MKLQLRLTIIAIFFACTSAWPQSAETNGVKTFHFKSAYLGMSLADFKAQTTGTTIRVNTGKPNFLGRPSKKDSQLVQTPLCTDTLRDFPGDTGNLADGEVLCNPSPLYANPDLREVMETQLDSVIYRFYRSKLYEIDIIAGTEAFGALQLGFGRKYGPPDSVTSATFQNAYGATWTGKELHWHSSQQRIWLSEGPGNGPGQFSRKGLMGMFVDASLQPPVSPKQVDF